jgi:hypothetical protein
MFRGMRAAAWHRPDPVRRVAGQSGCRHPRARAGCTPRKYSRRSSRRRGSLSSILIATGSALDPPRPHGELARLGAGEPVRSGRAPSPGRPPTQVVRKGRDRRNAAAYARTRSSSGGRGSSARTRRGRRKNPRYRGGSRASYRHHRRACRVLLRLGPVGSGGSAELRGQPEPGAVPEAVTSPMAPT